MPLPGFPDRPQVRQRWFTPNAITVGVLPTPLVNDPSIYQSYCVAFAVSVPQAAANNVFIGGPGVALASGLEIVAGSGPVLFSCNNQSQAYELQDPMLRMARIIQCEGIDPAAIPIVCWDISQVFLIASAATAIGAAYFCAEFI